MSVTQEKPETTLHRFFEDLPRGRSLSESDIGLATSLPEQRGKGRIRYQKDQGKNMLSKRPRSSDHSPGLNEKKRTNCDTEVGKERRHNEHRVDDRPRESSGSDDAILSPEDTLSIRHKPIVLDYNSQEQQAVIEEAPAWAKLLYREVKSQSAQYAQFKMQFNTFKAVVNQRLTEYEESAEFISS